MEFNFKRLFVASVTGGSLLFGGAAMAAGVTLPHIGTPASLSAKTPAISTPALSTPSKTTPSESAWADTPSVALPGTGAGMTGDVHDWSLDEPNGAPSQHLQFTVPAIKVPSISVPGESVPSKSVDVTLPASASVDPAAGTADASANAAGKSVGISAH